MHSLLRILRLISSQLRRENLHWVAFVLLALILMAAVAFWYFEEKLGFFDAFWWSVVTVTTVGYGDISPATPAGRFVGIALMMLGIGFLGVLTATIASVFIENKLMENKGMKRVTVKGHFVICGWNFRGCDIVEELRADQKSKDVPIVVIAELNEKPLDDSNLRFIRGQVQPKVLERANLKEAQTVIVLSDDRLDTHVRDAKTILDTLTIKSLYPEVYVCVELIESKNVEHCQMTKADEIIVVGELSTNLLVQAALDHGITHMITELVSNRYGNELYKIEPPSSLVGLTFFEVMCELKKNHGILCLAVENRRSHKLIANPDAGYRLGPEDELVVIATSRPELR
ncbi:MAG: NAD-binding protein [Deltaproteobacteria bacterium]|nr:NAD-binding protein [Deltaproteobacteria bacterium]